MNQNLTHNWDNICNITDEDIVQANIEGKPICLEVNKVLKINTVVFLNQKILEHLHKTKICHKLSDNEYKFLTDIQIIYNDTTYTFKKGMFFYL